MWSALKFTSITVEDINRHEVDKRQFLCFSMHETCTTPYNLLVLYFGKLVVIAQNLQYSCCLVDADKFLCNEMNKKIKHLKLYSKWTCAVFAMPFKPTSEDYKCF